MNKIASTLQYRNFILIFMEDGRIYKMVFDDDCINFKYFLLDRFDPQ